MLWCLLRLLPALNNVLAINGSVNSFISSHMLLWNRRNLNPQNNLSGAQFVILE